MTTVDLSCVVLVSKEHPDDPPMGWWEPNWSLGKFWVVLGEVTLNGPGISLAPGQACWDWSAQMEIQDSPGVDTGDTLEFLPNFGVPLNAPDQTIASETLNGEICCSPGSN